MLGAKAAIGRRIEPEVMGAPPRMWRTARRPPCQRLSAGSVPRQGATRSGAAGARFVRGGRVWHALAARMCSGATCARVVAAVGVTEYARQALNLVRHWSARDAGDRMSTACWASVAGGDRVLGLAQYQHGAGILTSL